MFYWDYRGLKVFKEFWEKYVKEIYKDVGDFAVPQQGIFSIKLQQPQYWRQYMADGHNYVYLYEILSPEQAEMPHAAPYNFLLEESMYSGDYWKKNILSMEK